MTSMPDEATGAGTGGTESAKKGVDVWMIVAIVAIVVAVVASYLALRYKQEVDDWEAAASETIAALQAAGIELRGTVESGVAGFEEQIADLSGALEQSQTEAGISAAQLEEAEQALADTQAELESTQQELDATQQDLADATNELEETQAALDDANAQLESLGELVLPSGTYVGSVLAARTEPFPAIVFQDGTAWRVAEVDPNVTITVGGQTLSLDEFATFLQSTDPGAAALANGDFEVVIEGSSATSISSVEV
ncbi:MAG TPA: hypothetical protein VFK59_09350 [Actinomycetota bacterium]|nr:hypothetical protein [Actinomycetota bacterium]